MAELQGRISNTGSVRVTGGTIGIYQNTLTIPAVNFEAGVEYVFVFSWVVGNIFGPVTNGLPITFQVVSDPGGVGLTDRGNAPRVYAGDTRLIRANNRGIPMQHIVSFVQPGTPVAVALMAHAGGSAAADIGHLTVHWFNVTSLTVGDRIILREDTTSRTLSSAQQDLCELIVPAVTGRTYLVWYVVEAIPGTEQPFTTRLRNITAGADILGNPTQGPGYQGVNPGGRNASVERNHVGMFGLVTSAGTTKTLRVQGQDAGIFERAVVARTVMLAMDLTFWSYFTTFSATTVANHFCANPACTFGAPLSISYTMPAAMEIYVSFCGWEPHAIAGVPSSFQSYVYDSRNQLLTQSQPMGHMAETTNGGAAHVLHVHQAAPFASDSIEMRGRQNLVEPSIGGQLDLYFASAAVWSVKTDQIQAYPVMPTPGAPILIIPMRESLAVASLPVLPIEPSFSIGNELEFETIVHQFELKYSQSWPKFTKPRQLLRLVWENLTTADKVTLMAFLDSRRGGLTAFRWTPPGEIEAGFVTRGGEPAKSQLHPNAWTVEADVFELVFSGS